MASKGAAGGRALLEQRGPDYFGEIGRKGGRPRVRTIADVRRGRNHRVPAEVIKSNNLKVLLAELRRVNDA